MTDVSPELYEKIIARYEELKNEDKNLSAAEKYVLEGDKYGMGEEYARVCGKHLSQALTETLTPENLPNGTLYYNISENTIGKALRMNAEEIGAIADQIQENINRAAGISLKPVNVPVNESRIHDIVSDAADSRNAEELKNNLGEPVEMFSQSVMDDHMRANAEFHNSAGLEVRVEREYDGVGLHNGTEVCDWCLERAGVWSYEQAMANGVFARHDGCGCIIDYTSKKGERSRSTDKWGFERIKEPVNREKFIVEEMASKVMMKKHPVDDQNFKTFNNTNSDTIRPKHIRNELQKSEKGNEILNYIVNDNVQIYLCYGVDNPEKSYGSYDPLSDETYIYCDICKTTEEAASTVIHEMIHRQNRSAGLSLFEDEYMAFEAEMQHKKHRLMLTLEERNDIIKTIEDVYGLYER